MTTKSVARSATYRVCTICERSRVGAWAPSWPADDELCPKCRAVVERADELNIGPSRD